MSEGRSIGTLQAVRIAGPGAEYLADREPVDIFVDDGRIVDIAPTGALPGRGEVLDAGGGFAMPGLWDNHVHTMQWALAAERQRLDDTASPAEAARRMATVEPLADGRRVGTGYRDALWTDALTLDVLDAATGDVPTYLINADVHSVWLNSAALRREGMSAVDGVVREDAAFEVSRRLNGVDEAHGDRAVRLAGERAAARGVTGLVDFEMAWNAEAWSRRMAGGRGAQRVEFAIYPADLERAIASGLHTGDALDDTNGLVRVGPLKVISDGSLGTRTAACSQPYAGDRGNRGAMNVDPLLLVDLLTRATAAGLSAAVHAIGDLASASALDAFALAGATGTLEHAQLIRHTDIARMARLGVIASIQPVHAVDDRDVADRLWREQTALAYPMASLRRAGVTLRFGSDAPVSPLDPWQGIAAAVTRTADERVAWNPVEAVSVDDALRASVRSEVRPGEVADIVVLAADPAAASGEQLRRMPVQATLLGGRLTYTA